MCLQRGFIAQRSYELFSAEGGASTTKYVHVTIHPHSACTLVLWNHPGGGVDGWVRLE